MSIINQNNELVVIGQNYSQGESNNKIATTQFIQESINYDNNTNPVLNLNYITITTGSTPVKLYYEDFGPRDANPVILIHGWPLSGRSWENQVPALIAAGFRVITYDRRGFGKSSQPYDGYNYDIFASDLHEIIIQLNLNHVSLVGFSMGGGEVARYIGIYGIARIFKVVFAAAVPPYLGKPTVGISQETILSLQNGVKNDRPAFLDTFITNFFTTDASGLLVSQPLKTYSQQIANFASPKGTLDCISAFSNTNFTSDLQKIVENRSFGNNTITNTVPALIIHGDSDLIVPYEISGEKTYDIISGLTGSNVYKYVIANGPHGINVTNKDEFNTILIYFLRLTVGLGSSRGTIPPQQPDNR